LIWNLLLRLRLSGYHSGLCAFRADSLRALLAAQAEADVCGAMNFIIQRIERGKRANRIRPSA